MKVRRGIVVLPRRAAALAAMVIRPISRYRLWIEVTPYSTFANAWSSTTSMNCPERISMDSLALFWADGNTVESGRCRAERTGHRILLRLGSYVNFRSYCQLFSDGRRRWKLPKPWWRLQSRWRQERSSEQQHCPIQSFSQYLGKWLVPQWYQRGRDHQRMRRICESGNLPVISAPCLGCVGTLGRNQFRRSWSDYR